MFAHPQTARALIKVGTRPSASRSSKAQRNRSESQRPRYGELASGRHLRPTGVEGRDDDAWAMTRPGGTSRSRDKATALLELMAVSFSDSLILDTSESVHVNTVSTRSRQFCKFRGKQIQQVCPKQCRYTAFKGNPTRLKAFCRNVLWADFQAGCRRFDPVSRSTRYLF